MAGEEDTRKKRHTLHEEEYGPADKDGTFTNPQYVLYGFYMRPASLNKMVNKSITLSGGIEGEQKESNAPAL